MRPTNMITTVITRLITYIVFIAHFLLLLFLQFEKTLENYPQNLQHSLKLPLLKYEDNEERAIYNFMDAPFLLSLIFSWRFTNSTGNISSFYSLFGCLKRHEVFRFDLECPLAGW